MPGHPPGHYYSPIVDPEAIRDRFNIDRGRSIETLPALNVSAAELQERFQQVAPFIGKHKFPEHKTDGLRYYYDNGFFPLGDAVMLSAIIAHNKPAKIIEIGSGFSTAAMLDAIDRDGLDTRVMCVEPYPARLRENLTEDDAKKVTIIESPVEATDPALYSTLEAGDILFIDSTHVLKTGSDVCFELFEILPVLKPGVLVHFHDIHYPFEYTDSWVFEFRRSWNEIYAVRAFLMYNDRFKIVFFNNYFGTHHRDQMAEAYGEPVPQTGGGLWLEVQA
ncbi:class I SAM-dependent methyltransferase [Parasphingopyxis sp.]|uniref:class I SAM-dependent methyltransferase n=1 Tax=Parasphingopyxis sp. TaxID=1920299 RepID=UPI00260F0A1E|nr:class I SAM-dependent methyltransferase [Parasphingopyxis sp.]